MTLLHTSIAAEDPETVARFLADLTGGPALPFPPCPGAWIAFGRDDDGRAVEVYPNGRRVHPGQEAIEFAMSEAETEPVSTHVALGSVLSTENVIERADALGWLARVCDRGPFSCVEVWVENRLLIEVLDSAQQSDYARGMTADNWRRMFGLEGE